MFGMFKRKSGPPLTPPPLPSTTAPPVIPVASSAPAPPVISIPPREQHHRFTHELIPDCFLGQHRARFVGQLFRQDFQNTMRSAWTAMGFEFGAAAIPAAMLEVSVFKYETHVLGVFQFPPTTTAGEAILGLIAAGPFASGTPEEIDKASARYFVLERTSSSLTAILECLPTGFVRIGSGPQLSGRMTDFTDAVMEHVFGKKRPTAQEAACRLLVLKNLVVYSHAVPFGKALHAHADVPPVAKADLHTIMGGMFSETLKKNDLWDDISPNERAFFECPVEKLTQQQVINASWRSEAVRTLLWALGMIPDFPPYDSRAQGEITKLVSTNDGAGFITSAKLRDEKEIDKARETAELWHWRSRTRQMMEENYPFKPSEAMSKAGLNTLADIVRVTAHEASKRGDLPPCIADDFPAKGKAYRELTAEEWSEVRSVTVERHYTLNWLCGYAPLNQWDKTPTET